MRAVLAGLVLSLMTIAPFGGAAFHDNKVWVRRLDTD